MLVLSRRVGQAIRVGSDIEIVVLETDGAQVRLGVRAPREIPILRGELVQQVEAENRLAVASVSSSLLVGLGAELSAAPPAVPAE
jgi:carbon storage regulator